MKVITMGSLTSGGQRDQAVSLLNTVYVRVRNQAAPTEAAELLEAYEGEAARKTSHALFCPVPFDFCSAVY